MTSHVSTPSTLPTSTPWTALLLAVTTLSPSLTMAKPVDDALAPLSIVGKRPSPLIQRPSVFDLDVKGAIERGATGLDGLLSDVPGVQPNPGEPGQSLPTLRGIGTSTNSQLLGTQQATTGIYVDDVPLTSPFGFVGTPDLTDFSLDRLMVARGPQGALYGSASLGGAIQYVLGKPGREQPGGHAQAGVSLPDTGGVGSLRLASIDAPLAGDAGAVRVEAFQRRTPGDIDNLGTGQSRANTVRREGVRATARWWWPMGGVSDLTLLHQRQHSEDTAAASPDDRQRKIQTPTASPSTNDFNLVRLGFETPLSSGHTLTSISALVTQQRAERNDLTRGSGALGQVYGPQLGLGPLPVLPMVQSVQQQPMRNVMWSQELRMSTQGPSGLGYVAGLFLQTATFDAHSTSVAPGGQALWGPAGFLLPGDELGDLAVHARTQERAVFGELHLRGPAEADISLGGRAYRTALAYRAQLRFLGNPSSGSPKIEEGGFTPLVAVALPWGQNTLFATLAGGYRFGGVNFNPPELTPYRSDRLLDREIGIRLRTIERLKVDVSAFVIDWKDAQVSTLLGGAVPLIGVANVGQARSTGLEAAWHWQAPAGFELSGALACTNAHTVASFTTASGNTLPAGSRLPGTPRWHTQWGLSRAFELADGRTLQAQVSHNHVGSRVFNIDGNARASGYARVDASLSLLQPQWTLIGSVYNLTNARGVTGAEVVDRPGVAHFTDWYVLPARTLGLTLSHRW